MNIKELIKNHAYELGADLVGFGNVERCENAPIMMSPQGIFPAARTIVVMALHHPDACIELGGEIHPQEIGPYSVQYLMNSRLDEMSYRLATFIEKQGYGAIPIVSSNIWRYNQYKELKAVFAPDVSHIYMSVAAGLADMGYNGLALTPEYGARNRFITVITDAVIEADPLIPPGTVCDQCMLCRKHCPAQAFDREVEGEKILEIENYKYTFPDKNLWRCAWGEHFDLDLDLEIPETVTEKVIAEQVERHGLRGGEMGQCLKFCLPPELREWDRDYSRSPLRRYTSIIDETAESRAVTDRVFAQAHTKGAELILVRSASELAAFGISLEKYLPGAKTAILIATRKPPRDNQSTGESEQLFENGMRYQVNSICYDVTREIESMGFRSIMTIKQSSSHPDDIKVENITGAITAIVPELNSDDIIGNTVITRKDIPSRTPPFKMNPASIDRSRGNATLTSSLVDTAFELGADLAGIAPNR